LLCSIAADEQAHSAYVEKPMENYRLVPVVSMEELEMQLESLAVQINRDYEGKNPVVVGVLKGAFVFLADLVRRLSFPLEVDFVRLASYGTESETSGVVRITKDVEIPLKGRHVLIVEDIVDTGTTLAWYIDRLREQEAASVKICALIDKHERRKVPVPLEYVGISIDKGFLVGYGLDFSENFRHLPGIFEVVFTK
jgi:hypoxanthine phosphoribosyltransferase